MNIVFILLRWSFKLDFFLVLCTPALVYNSDSHLPIIIVRTPEIIIKIGPAPGMVIPKLETKVLGSSAPETSGIIHINPKIKLG